MATSYLFSVFRGRSGARWILTQCRRSEERFRGFRGSPLTIQSTLFAMGVGGLMLGGVHFAAERSVVVVAGHSVCLHRSGVHPGTSPGDARAIPDDAVDAARGCDRHPGAGGLGCSVFRRRTPCADGGADRLDVRRNRLRRAAVADRARSHRARALDEGASSGIIHSWVGFRVGVDGGRSALPATLLGRLDVQNVRPRYVTTCHFHLGHHHRGVLTWKSWRAAGQQLLGAQGTDHNEFVRIDFSWT